MKNYISFHLSFMHSSLGPFCRKELMSSTLWLLMTAAWGGGKKKIYPYSYCEGIEGRGSRYITTLIVNLGVRGRCIVNFTL